MTASTPTVAFAGKAVDGVGGQGQFLRTMTRALDDWGAARVYAREARSTRAEAVNLPFRGGWRRAAFDALLTIPVLRGRNDWLTQLDEADFDRRLSGVLAPCDLFDGVMAQCAVTRRRRAGLIRRSVVTALNCHPDHLAEVLADEHRRLGVAVPSFVHPRMQQRVREELSSADAIRVCSQLAAQTFVERGAREAAITVIPIGIDLAHFHTVPRTDDVFRVLAVASIDPRKGMVYLLRAFAQAALPGAELVIIGGTGDRWSRALMADYRTRHPNIRVEAMDVAATPVTRHYGRASVVVHPALEDGFGLVIPQALACGRPVIATRQSGASEHIRDGDTGFVIEARDVDALVDRLRWCHAHAQDCAEMGARGPASIAHLSERAHTEAVARFYRKVLAS